MQGIPSELNLLSLTQTYGAPLYVYDGNKIIHQYNRLKQAFK